MSIHINWGKESYNSGSNPQTSGPINGQPNTDFTHNPPDPKGIVCHFPAEI